ncbi:DUF4440 domain-containing protein [Sphingomonas sp. LB-2]|uniref:YybH family protein n=1 Tax=Sphingomonas caeni TaxID=2984949 RepID=UPI0022310F00|nr:DUF4440 domain-containing protein [Sphingomonas caeni]MCW3847617.1 DUF4440 domain-containing protein [Sphingomonas caeni]
MRLLIAMAAMAVAAPGAAQTIQPDDGIAVNGIRAQLEAVTAIMRGMEDSAKGWNEGNIDRFLAIYSDDPGTSFAGSDGVAYGKAGIRARYLKRYTKQFGSESSSATRSTLNFTKENFRLIGPDHALLIARWTLVSGAQVQSGMTSLLFRKEAGGWKIIADHSS